jgi:hypothetical protein
VRVPADFVAKSMPERKVCKSAWGMAGRIRLKIIAEIANDEKKTDSKVKYLKGTMPYRDYAALIFSSLTKPSRSPPPARGGPAAPCAITC